VINDEAVAQFSFTGMLREDGINSYIIYPIHDESGLVGVLEMSSTKPGRLHSALLSQLEPSFPLIAQALNKKIDQFNEQLEAVIKDKFTSVQPSVEWKFNEIAWEYLKTKSADKYAQIGNVVFEEVYPLYGAIDIRNSSVERNHAIKKDLQEQLTAINDTLESIQASINLPLSEELQFKSKQLLHELDGEFSTGYETRISHFLETAVNPFFGHIQRTNPAARKAIEAYFSHVDEKLGHVYHHRREYEESMEQINTAINNYLEEEKDKIQAAYPNYFEKYKTDGVEYNIYIGQSIAPGIPFDLIYLRNLRLWQLTSMVAMARIAEGLVPSLKVHLHTTQLLLVHSAPLAISFRKDERRFDVDGAYNIRYEIIKKRIDKALIKNTGERLTQPGKIAIVYSNAADAEEYLKFIEFLQSKELLDYEVEKLELEEMQGVSDMHALRVGVMI
jgi:hypothetical protein